MPRVSSVGCVGGGERRQSLLSLFFMKKPATHGRRGGTNKEIGCTSELGPNNFSVEICLHLS